MRLDEISKAVQFLQSSQISGVPMSQQIQFLEQKGLSAEEIGHVVAQVTLSASKSLPAQNSWLGSLAESILPIAAMAAVGSVAYFLSHRLLPDPRPITIENTIAMDEKAMEDGVRQDDVDDMDESIQEERPTSDDNEPTDLQKILELMERQSEAMEKLREENKQLTEHTAVDLQRDVGVIREALAAIIPALHLEDEASHEALKLLQQSSSSLSAAATSPYKQKSSSSAVNALIDNIRQQQHQNESSDRYTSSSSTTTPINGMTSPMDKGETEEVTSLPEEEEEVNISEIKDKAEQEIREALDSMMSSNQSKKVMAPALDMLLMYLTNVQEHASNPRYRRISTVNTSFRTTLAVVPNHSLFLAACGFNKSQTASFYEWTWAADKDKESLWKARQELLQVAIQLLNTARERLEKREEDLNAAATTAVDDTASNTITEVVEPASNIHVTSFSDNAVV